MVLITNQGGFLEKSEESMATNMFNSDNSYYWLSYLMVILFRMDTISEYGDFSKLFEQIGNYDIEIWFKKLISNTINKMKNEKEEFDLDNYVTILNSILKHYNIATLSLDEKIEVEGAFERNNYSGLQDIQVNNIKLTANTVNIINNNQIQNMFYDTQPINKQGLNFNDLNTTQSPQNNFLSNLNFMFDSGNPEMYKLLYANLLMKHMNTGFPGLFQQDISSYYNILLAKLLQTNPINTISNSLNTGMNLNLLLMLLNKNLNQPKVVDESKRQDQNNSEKKLLSKKREKKSEIKKKNLKSISEFDLRENRKKSKEKTNDSDIIESHFLENEKPLPLKSELDKYLPNYEKDKEEICKDSAHSFMNTHFPEVYRLDNFYVNIITRKEKWEKKKQDYLVGITNDYTLFRNIVEQKKIEIRENDMNKVWNATSIPLPEGN
jgi:hypothetical protein